MPQYEPEIVKIIWDIESPEAAITKLITRLGDIDTKLGEVAQKAAQFGANIALSLNAAGASADALVGKMERALAGMEAVAARSGSVQPRDPLTGQMMNWGAFQQQYGSPLASQAQAQAQAIENLVRSGMSRADAEAGVRAATRGAGYSPFQARASLYEGQEDWLIGRRPPPTPPGGNLPPIGGPGWGPWMEFDPETGKPLQDDAMLEQIAQAMALKNQRSRMAMEAALARQRSREERAGLLDDYAAGNRRESLFRPYSTLIDQFRQQAGVDFEQDIQGQAFREGYDAWAPIKNQQMRQAATAARQGAEWQRQAAFQPGIDAMRAQARAQFQPEIDAGAFRKQYDAWASLERSRLQEQAQMQQAIPTAGLTGAAQTQAFQANLGLANTKLDELFQNYQRLRTPESRQAWENQAKAVDQYKQSIKDAGGGLDEFNSRFIRHMTWIAQGILIWEGFRIVQGILQGMTTEMINLENVSARLALTTGQPLQAAITGVAGAAVQAARYGIAPTQAGPGTLAAAQLGASAAQQEQARQLALVFGADQHQNALTELYQVQLRASAAGIEYVDVLGFMATALQEIPRSLETDALETYADALQVGIRLQGRVGLSAELMGLALANAAVATESSAETIGAQFERVISRISKPEVIDELRGFGVQPGPLPQVIGAIADAANQLVASGKMERFEELMRLVAGGSLQAGQQLRDFPLILKIISDALDDPNKKLADFGRAVELTTGTTQSSFAILTASVKAWFGTLVAGYGAMDGFLERLVVLAKYGIFSPQGLALTIGGARDVAGAAAGLFNLQSQANLFEQQTGKQAYLNQAGGLGLGGMPVLIVNPEFQRWLDNANNPARMERSWAADAARWQAQADFYNPPPGKGQLAFPEPPAFGGFQTFPKGQDWDQFRSLVRKYETQIQAEVPGYTLDRQQVAFWDETTKHYRTLIGDTNAIRFATEEQRKLMAEQITGVFNIPDSGRALVAFYALQQGYVPRDRAEALMSGAGSFPKAKEISDQITTAVYTVNDTLLTFGDIFGAARDAYGGGKQPGGIPKVTDGVDVYSQYLPVIEEGASKGRQGMQRRQNFTRRMLPEDALFSKIQREQDELIAAEGLGGSRSDTPMRSRRSTAQRAQPLSVPITINSRIVINVDGRRIQQMINRQTYQQFSQIAGGAGVAAGSSVL